MLVVLIGVIAVVVIVTYLATASQANNAKPAARPKVEEVVEEGFTSGSIEYGRSVMDHPMLEREAAKLCEKIETDLRNGKEIFYEIYGGCESMYYVQDYIGCRALLEDRLTSIYYPGNAFPSEGQEMLKGYDQELGAAWALQHLALAKLRREMPKVVRTIASVESGRSAKCNVSTIVRK